MTYKLINLMGNTSGYTIKHKKPSIVVFFPTHRSTEKRKSVNFTLFHFSANSRDYIYTFRTEKSTQDSSYNSCCHIRINITKYYQYFRAPGPHRWKSIFPYPCYTSLTHVTRPYKNEPQLLIKSLETPHYYLRHPYSWDSHMFKPCCSTLGYVWGLQLT